MPKKPSTKKYQLDRHTALLFFNYTKLRKKIQTLRERPSFFLERLDETHFAHFRDDFSTILKSLDTAFQKVKGQPDQYPLAEIPASQTPGILMNHLISDSIQNKKIIPDQPDPKRTLSKTEMVIDKPEITPANTRPRRGLVRTKSIHQNMARFISMTDFRFLKRIQPYFTAVDHEELNAPPENQIR